LAIAGTFLGHICLKTTRFTQRLFRIGPAISLNFQHVYKLFEQLARARAKGEDAAIALVQSWVREHNKAIPHEEPQALALLSYLLPARRADRVYSLQEGRLHKTIQNAQGLSKCRILELQR
jgi:DNA ligase N terminus